VHTSVYSSIEAELPAIADRGTAVSFDYSNDAAGDIVRATARHVDVGFFSGGALSEGEVDALAAFALECGMTSVVITLGSRGARAFEAGATHTGRVVPVDAVDALGAGDAFITGFLAARASGADIARSLEGVDHRRARLHAARSVRLPCEGRRRRESAAPPPLSEGVT
jgi:fructoselysine 6-kinase